MINFHYWYMFFVSIIIAAFANAVGIGGATFFSPIFILGLKLPVEVAVGTALITEVFGFTSGVIGYAHRKLVDYKLAGKVLITTIPFAVIGAISGHYINERILKIIFAAGIIFLATKFLEKPDDKEVALLNKAIQEDYGETGKTTIITRSGEKIRYTVCNAGKGRILTSLGGFFLGIISTGLGELNSFFFLRTCRVPNRVAAGTSVVIISISALIAATTHVKFFISLGPSVFYKVLEIVVFTVPGVIIGGQLGPLVSSAFNKKILEPLLGVLFILIGIIIGIGVFL